MLEVHHIKISVTVDSKQQQRTYEEECVRDKVIYPRVIRNGLSAAASNYYFFFYYLFRLFKQLFIESLYFIVNEKFRSS